MLGLEKVYDDLDGVRKRLIRLIEMERLPEKVGLSLIAGVFETMEKINKLIDKAEEGEKNG